MNVYHVTDVGAPHWNGSDSTLRILKQYWNLWVDATVISAWKSPLHVAFTWCTVVHPDAQERAERVYKLISPHTDIPRWAPIALNCAPRNAQTQLNGAQENSIFRLRSEDSQSFLIYGPEVLSWCIDFIGRNKVKIQKILSLHNGNWESIISDTSKWSQFRSAEHLPLVHILEATWKLDQYSRREEVDMPSILSPLSNFQWTWIVLPHDEFLNGRILMSKESFAGLSWNVTLSTGGIEMSCQHVNSLTEIEPWKLAIWQSSNAFPNSELVAANIGTRWYPGETTLTDSNVIHSMNAFSQNVGQIVSFRNS